MLKVAVIGYGASAIGVLEGLKNNKDIEITVFEKGKDIHSCSMSGIKSDGKLFISESMGGDIHIPLDVQEDVVNYYLLKTNGVQPEHGVSFADDSVWTKRFEAYGFDTYNSKFFHIGTDVLKVVVDNIYQEHLTRKNINFKFGYNIKSIAELPTGQISVDDAFVFDKVFVCVGRSGHKLVESITKEYPNLIASNNKVDIGIRYELPNDVLEHINKEMYEFKISKVCKTGYKVRTFCNNPSGEVTTEKYDGFTTANGHSNHGMKTDFTNMAILVTVELTEPFNNPIEYASNIAKISNLLTGKNKVICQTYEKFTSGKRSKNSYLIPSLDSDKYIYGDINLSFPKKICDSIIEFIDSVGSVINGFSSGDNLMYSPEIKFYSTKIDNDIIKNLKIVGDCSGLTRSITYATSHGLLEARKLLKEVE